MKYEKLSSMLGVVGTFTVISSILLFIFFILATLFCGCNSNSKPVITGSGSSFAFPVYSNWAHEYHGPVDINYQSVGSGAGINQIREGITDFGGSDEPLTQEELDASNLIQYPIIASGIVLVFNIEGITDIKLSPDTVVDIFLGKIVNWNDQRINDLNPDIQLPDQAINVVHRSDGSGSTWLFTTYLSKISDEWKNEHGAAKAISWPTGIGNTVVGAKGNEGVSVFIKQLQGSIGYVEYSYAIENKIPMVSLMNHSGVFLKPSPEKFTMALTAVETKISGKENKSDRSQIYVDNPPINQEGVDSWPITGITFILLKKDGKFNEQILNFFKWGIYTRFDIPKKLGYTVINCI